MSNNDLRPLYLVKRCQFCGDEVHIELGCCKEFQDWWHNKDRRADDVFGNEYETSEFNF